MTHKIAFRLICTAGTSSGRGSCILLFGNETNTTGGCLPKSLNKTSFLSRLSLMFVKLFLTTFGTHCGVPRSSSSVLVVFLVVFLVAGHLPGVGVVFSSVLVPNILAKSPTLLAESVVTFLHGLLVSLLSPHTFGGTSRGGCCCWLPGKVRCGGWLVVGGVMITIVGVFNPAHCAILQRVVPGGTETVPPYLICTLWLP